MRRALTLVFAVQLATATMAGAAGKDRPDTYRLAPGDVVEFAVTGMPELRQRATIDVAGEVTLPLVGAVRAAGLPLSDLISRVQQLASRSVVRQRTLDGREISIVVNASEVYLRIAEYRPVYVDGDVSKPGEVAYRPGMTVRQALALAGGYDISRFEANNPFLQGPDLASDHRILAAERARGQLKIARLEAELAGQPELPAVEIADTAVSPHLLTHFRDLEAAQFETRSADRVKERAYLEAVLKQLDALVSTLTAQQESEAAGLRADQEEMERMKDLLEKGTASMLRITDTRRNLLLSSTRLLQTTANLERTRREREEIARRLGKIGDDDRLEITRQLEDARMQLAGTQSRIAATTEKLLYTSVVRSQLLRGTGGDPQIVVLRRDDSGSTRLLAEDDTVLRPGDVIEVALVAGSEPAPRPESRAEAQPPTR